MSDLGKQRAQDQKAQEKKGEETEEDKQKTAEANKDQSGAKEAEEKKEEHKEKGEQQGDQTGASENAGKGNEQTANAASDPKPSNAPVEKQPSAPAEGAPGETGPKGAEGPVGESAPEGLPERAQTPQDVVNPSEVPTRAEFEKAMAQNRPTSEGVENTGSGGKPNESSGNVEPSNTSIERQPAEGAQGDIGQRGPEGPAGESAPSGNPERAAAPSETTSPSTNANASQNSAKAMEQNPTTANQGPAASEQSTPADPKTNTPQKSLLDKATDYTIKKVGEFLDPKFEAKTQEAGLASATLENGITQLELGNLSRLELTGDQLGKPPPTTPQADAAARQALFKKYSLENFGSRGPQNEVQKAYLVNKVNQNMNGWYDLGANHNFPNTNAAKIQAAFGQIGASMELGGGYNPVYLWPTPNRSPFQSMPR